MCNSRTSRGENWKDSAWHYFDADLDADANDLFGAGLYSVLGLEVIGRDVYLDNVVLSGGRLDKSWQVLPGAALGGLLAAQTGAGGSVGSGTALSPAVAAWGKYYYHYNDLGTVQAATKADGTMLGAYEPDFYGNYRHVHGSRPDAVGLTGKKYDAASGLYYFGYRWYDPERGRWMSEEPLDIDHQYGFNYNNPLNYYDPDGLLPKQKLTPQGCRDLNEKMIKNLENIKKADSRIIGESFRASILASIRRCTTKGFSIWPYCRNHKTMGKIFRGFCKILSRLHESGRSSDSPGTSVYSST